MPKAKPPKKPKGGGRTPIAKVNVEHLTKAFQRDLRRSFLDKPEYRQLKRLHARERLSESRWEKYQRGQERALELYAQGRNLWASEPVIKQFVDAAVKVAREKRPPEEILKHAKLSFEDLKTIKRYNKMALESAELGVASQELFIRIVKAQGEKRALEQAEEKLLELKQLLLGAQRMNQVIKLLERKLKGKKD